MRALITGCGRRLGFYLSQKLRETGWQVLGHYRTERDSLQTLRSQGIELIAADLSNQESCLHFAHQLASYTDLSLVIHNASAFMPDTNDLKQQAQQFMQFFNVHMMAPYLINQSLAPILSQQQNPLIIHVTDICVHAPWPTHKAYIATKAGLDALSRSFAKAFAPEIRVNSIEPGPILFLEAHDQQYREQVLAKVPLGCEGGLMPIWQTVQFLLDNIYLTGILIKVDGGRSLAEL